MSNHHVRIFVSSPSDVASERDRVSKVVHRLESEFDALRFEVIRWEDSWYSASTGFQEQIVAPDQCDLVIVIVWKRLGSPLPDDFARTDGTTRTGTEYEFEVAMESSLKHEVPDILVYRKTEKILFDADRVDQERAELQALEGFWRRWLRNEKGHFTGAFKCFETADQFADQLERDLRVWLADRQSNVTWPAAKGSPFRGLEAFDAEHASVFFGRKRATRELRAKLLANANAEEARNFMVVVSASGSGKSSLVRAGLIPSLQREGRVFRHLSVTPSQLGTEPPGNLARHLFEVLPQMKDGDCPTPTELADLFETAPQRAAKPIEGAIRRSDAGEDQRLLILIDQLEELFQWPAESHEQFLSVIKALAASPQLIVIATLRSDFYPQLINSEVLKSLSADGRQYNLAPIREYELKEVLQGPAAAAGLEYESRNGVTLDQVLLDEAEDEAKVLPLLEFTLEQLYQDREEGRLTFGAYERLGGLSRAIGQHAEVMLRQVGGEDLFPGVMRKLVSVTEAGEAARKTAPLAGFPDEDCPLVYALIEARLLVTVGEQAPAVSLAHDALLNEWTRIREWLEEDRDFLRWYARAEREAAVWRAEGRPDARLLQQGKPLAEAEAWLAQRKAHLDKDTTEYIDRSSARARAKRRRLLTIAASVIIGLTALSLISWQQMDLAQMRAREAEEQRSIAELRTDEALVTQSRFLNDLARQASNTGRHDQALLLRLNALPGLYGGSRKVVPEILAAVEMNADLQRKLAILPTRGARHITFSPDGQIVATSSSRGHTVLWKLSSAQPITVHNHNGHHVSRTAFNRQGTRLLTTCGIDNNWVGVVELWDASGNQRVANLSLGARTEGSFSDDGMLAVTFTRDGHIAVWDSETGEMTSELYVEHGLVDAFLLKIGEQNRVVTASELGGISIWNTQTGEVIKKLTEKNIRSVVLSNDRKRLLALSAASQTSDSSSLGEEITVWSIPAGEQVSSIPVYEIVPVYGRVEKVKFSANGELIGAIVNETPLFWNATTGESVKSHGWARDLVLSPTGDTAVTVAGFDTSIRALDRGETWDLGKIKEFWYAQYSPDGRTILTLCCEVFSEEAALWHADRGGLIGELSHGATIHHAEFSPDGENLATIAGDMGIVWETRTEGEVLLSGQDANVKNVEFSQNGRLMMASGSKVVVADPDGHHVEIAVPRIDSASLSRSGNLFASISVDNKNAEVWDIDTEQLAFRVPPAPDRRIFDVAISPDDRFLATAMWRDSAPIWNIASGEEFLVLSDPKVTLPIARIEFNASGDSLLTTSAGNGEVIVWDAHDGSVLRTWSLDQRVKYAAFSPDGLYVVTASEDNSVKVWDTIAERPAHTFSHKSARYAEFSADGSSLVTASRATVIVWGLETGHPIAQFSRRSAPILRDTVRISADGKRIFIADQGETTLWDTGSGSPIQRIADNFMLDAAFSPNGLDLVVAGHGAKRFSMPPRASDVLSNPSRFLPLNRTCLTPKERDRFFLPPLTDEQWIKRGCPQFTQANRSQQE